MYDILTLFVYFFYDHIPTFFSIFKKRLLLLVIIEVHVCMRSKCSDSGRKPWTIVRRFDRN